MEKTKIPLQKWFLGIGLMVNAKKSLSSHQLASDLELNQKSAWYMQQCIRSQMASEQGSILLQGIVEADETYVGGKPRKANRREDDTNDHPRGRGTRKTPVIGVVERAAREWPAWPIVSRAVPSSSFSAALSYPMVHC